MKEYGIDAEEGDGKEVDGEGVHGEEFDGKELDGEGDYGEGVDSEDADGGDARSRVSCSDIYNFSDLDDSDSDADLLKEARRLAAKRSGRSASASVCTLASTATHRPSAGGAADASMSTKRLGSVSVTHSATHSEVDMGSCRSTWNMYTSTTQSREWETSTPRLSFGDFDLDDIMDLDMAGAMPGLLATSEAFSSTRISSETSASAGYEGARSASEPLPPTPAAEEGGQPAAAAPHFIAKSHAECPTAAAHAPPRKRGTDPAGSDTKRGGAARSSEDPFVSAPKTSKPPPPTSEDPFPPAPKTSKPPPPTNEDSPPPAIKTGKPQLPTREDPAPPMPETVSLQPPGESSSSRSS